MPRLVCRVSVLGPKSRCRSFRASVFLNHRKPTCLPLGACVHAPSARPSWPIWQRWPRKAGKPLRLRLRQLDCNMDNSATSMLVWSPCTTHSQSAHERATMPPKPESPKPLCLQAWFECRMPRPPAGFRPRTGAPERPQSPLGGGKRARKKRLAGATANKAQ